MQAVEAALELDWRFSNRGDIEVTVSGGKFLLEGKVVNLAEKMAAARIARESGALSVENKLQVAPVRPNA